MKKNDLIVEYSAKGWSAMSLAICDNCHDERATVQIGTEYHCWRCADPIYDQIQIHRADK